jgi:ketosteroid isomerase-like protein
MSKSRAEVLRELNESFNSGADWIHFYDPDAEFEMPPEWPEEATYRGHEGLRKALALWRENFDEYHWEEDQLIDGPDCIVGLYHQRGRIKRTDTWIDQKIGCVWQFRGERIIRVRGFISWEAALEAAGIER